MYAFKSYFPVISKHIGISSYITSSHLEVVAHVAIIVTAQTANLNTSNFIWNLTPIKKYWKNF